MKGANAVRDLLLKVSQLLSRTNLIVFTRSLVHLIEVQASSFTVVCQDTLELYLLRSSENLTIHTDVLAPVGGKQFYAIFSKRLNK